MTIPTMNFIKIPVSPVTLHVPTIQSCSDVRLSEISKHCTYTKALCGLDILVQVVGFGS